MEDRLISDVELAKILGVTVQTIRAWRKHDKPMPKSKLIGNSYKTLMSDVEKFLYGEEKDADTGQS